MAFAPSGELVVVWQSYGSGDTDSSLGGILAERYDADGAPVSGEFQINACTSSGQYGPAVAFAPSGGFVVVWNSYGYNDADTSLGSIQVWRFDSAGDSPRGSESRAVHWPCRRTLVLGRATASSLAAKGRRRYSGC